jgi:DNA-directed RNA polymerase I subunit RPA1
MKKALKKPGKYPPVLSEYSPSRNMGAMSETFAKDLNKYIDSNPHGYISRKGVWAPSAYSSTRVSDKEFLSLARVRYMRSVVDPGEAVGLLASQG